VTRCDTQIIATTASDPSSSLPPPRSPRAEPLNVLELPSVHQKQSDFTVTRPLSTQHPATSSADAEIVALAETIVHGERYGTDRKQEMYRLLRSMVGDSVVAADAVIARARSRYRQVVEMECGHQQHYLVTSSQLTGQDQTTWSRDLVYAPSYYRAGVKVYCETCPDRPATMCVGTTVDGFRITWTVLALECGHTVVREHVAGSRLRDHDVGLVSCAPCGGRRQRTTGTRPFELPAQEMLARDT
jgi:hypothetical protein